MAKFDSKEYARQMRENCVKDHNGNIICSDELWEQIASIIENIPAADVVEVVRCKECIFWEKGKGYTPYCNHPDSMLMDTNADDFCSYGERKER